MDSSSEHKLMDTPSCIAILKGESEANIAEDKFRGSMLLVGKTFIKTDSKSDCMRDSC